jgi:CheY-like chemotaxis protein
MQMPLILIIDQSAETRAIFGDYFRYHGYTVAEASSGAEGLRLFHELRPDLIVTELSNEPEWLEAMREMRGQRDGRRPATIICSIMIDPSWPFAPAGYDADLALAKPISPRALLLQAQQVLRARSRAARAIAV